MPMSSESRSITAHDLVAYGGGLFAVGVLLYQAWSGGSIEHVLSSAATSGLMSYLILAAGFAAARSIVTAVPDSDSPDETPDGSPEESATESEENHDQTAPESQAA